MIRVSLFLVLFVFVIASVNAQQISVQVIDSQTNEAVPFVTIKIADIELVSNEQGYFTFSQEKVGNSDLISITSIGYKPKNISVKDLKSSNNTIYIEAVIYDFGEIYVSNTLLDPYEIMKKVRDSLTKNYTNESYKNTFFSRTFLRFIPQKLDIDVKKSTGLSKVDKAKINQEIQQIADQMTKNDQASVVYSDKLFELYKNTRDKKASYKLHLQKYVTLEDKNKTFDLDRLEETATQTFAKLIDTTKFYRIKSGLFGSRDTISFNQEYNNKKKIKKEENVSQKAKRDSIVLDDTRTEIVSNLAKSSITDGAMLDFVHSYQNYDYTYIEATYLGDDLVFLLDFKPKKKKGKFEGRLYVNESDYAVLRADYQLVQGRKISGINLKFLLGIKFARNYCSGTIIFKKHQHTNSYLHHYFRQETGDYVYVSRPIKFIELAEKNRDVVAFKLKIEANIFTRTEYLNIHSQPVSKEEFETFVEPNFSIQFLKKYDPNIWKDYNIIEPLEEMKKFEIAE